MSRKSSVQWVTWLGHVSESWAMLWAKSSRHQYVRTFDNCSLLQPIFLAVNNTHNTHINDWAHLDIDNRTYHICVQRLSASQSKMVSIGMKCVKYLLFLFNLAIFVSIAYYHWVYLIVLRNTRLHINVLYVKQYNDSHKCTICETIQWSTISLQSHTA